MKKILFATIITATGLLFSACEPEVIVGPKADAPIAASDLQKAFFIDGQFADAACTTPQTDGNYIKFYTSPAVTVQISNTKSDGSKNILYTGASGVFNITPKRGNPTTQSFTITTINQDASTVSCESTVDVFVPSELDPGVKLLAGDGGFKAWKWYEIDGSCWGNCGYIGDPTHGADVASGAIPGYWWGARAAVDDDDVDGTLLDQLDHSGGTNYGDVYVGSYMVFDEDGNIISYKPDGTQIRKGSYTITGLDRSGDTYPYATLSTGDPAILFPFAINTGGNTMTTFEVAYIDDNLLTLIGNSSGAAGWSWTEATWWRFKNASDAEAALSAYDTRKWTYYSIEDACWGNGGYQGQPALADWASGEIAGKWWGCLPGDLEDGQIQHSGGVAYGYGHEDAYMTFDYANGTVTSYDKDGKAIKSSGYTVNYNFKVDGYTEEGAPAGTLVTDADKSGILYPFAINTSGAVETNYQIPYVDGNILILISNYNDASQGSWGEMTWWRFKPVK